MRKCSKEVILVDEGDITTISDSDGGIPTSGSHQLGMDLGNDVVHERRESVGHMITCVPIPQWERRPDRNGNVRTHYTVDELEFMMDSQCPPECSCVEICQLRYPDRKFQKSP